MPEDWTQPPIVSQYYTATLASNHGLFRRPGRAYADEAPRETGGQLET